MKSILALIALMTLAGCMTLDHAGNAAYSVRPFVIDDLTGETTCCEVSINNGKEIQNLTAHVVKNGDNYTVDLTEGGVTAFQGQAISAAAAQSAIDAAAKAAIAAALAPMLPALTPAAGAILSSGTTGAVVGGAALGIGANKLLSPATATIPILPTIPDIPTVPTVIPAMPAPAAK